MLQPGRVAWRCRAWLRDVPRAGSALRQAPAAPLGPGWSVPVWHAARLRVRGAGALRHCKLKVLRAPDPCFFGRPGACVRRVTAQCRIAEQHTQGGVLSTAVRRRDERMQS